MECDQKRAMENGAGSRRVNAGTALSLKPRLYALYLPCKRLVRCILLVWLTLRSRRALTLDEALLVLTTKLHYLPNALTLALDIYLHMVYWCAVLNPPL